MAYTKLFPDHVLARLSMVCSTQFTTLRCCDVRGQNRHELQVVHVPEEPVNSREKYVYEVISK